MSLSLQHVTKEFALKGKPPHVAVSDLSLEIENGRFYTLLGPSGCGKTTLLRMIAGFEQPTRGDIVHNGRSLHNVPPYRRGFPLVFQSYALFPHMTVLENVSYGLELRKLPRAQATERVARALSLLELESQRDKYPAQMSGGQQQRVALARALVLEPEIILLDEPLSNLDAELRVSMRGEIRSLQRRLGITAIYVTHDQEEALAISDQIVILNQGRIEQIGTPVEVHQRPETEFVARFMGCPNVFRIEATADLVLLGELYRDVMPPADARHVMLRSDAIQLTASGRHRAIVDEATFLGSRFKYLLRLDDGTRIATEQPWSGDSPALGSGDVVHFDIAVARLHFF